MISSRLPSHFLRAGILLAAMVVALATLGKAVAGCGDHAVILKSAGEAKNDAATEPTPKPPCHGPHCSATPSQPAAPPISAGVVISVTAKEVCTPVAPLDAGDRPAKRRAFEFFSPCPIDRASSIFHPPRA